MLRIRSLLLLPLTLLALPAAAGAVTTIDGTAMDTFVANNGQLNVRLTGQTDNIFYSTANGGLTGLFVYFPYTTANGDNGATVEPVSGQAVGPDSGQITAVSGPTLSGSGSAGDPFQTVTQYRVDNSSDSSAELLVQQTVQHVDGSRQLTVQYHITNQATVARNFRLGLIGNLIWGSSGLGQFLAGPPRQFLVSNTGTGITAGIQEDPTSPFDGGWQVGEWSTITGNLQGGGLDQSVLPSVMGDPTVAGQWDNYYTSTLASGASADFVAKWNFATLPPLGLTLNGSSWSVGTPVSLGAVITDLAGVTREGQTVRATVTGANAASPVAPASTDAGGATTLSYTPGAEGLDTVTAYVDFNGNGVKDTAEPQATATVSVSAASGGGGGGGGGGGDGGGGGGGGGDNPLGPPARLSKATVTVKAAAKGKLTVTLVCSNAQGCRAGTIQLKLTVKKGKKKKMGRVKVAVQQLSNGAKVQKSFVAPRKLKLKRGTKVQVSQVA